MRSELDARPVRTCAWTIQELLYTTFGFWLHLYHDEHVIHIAMYCFQPSLADSKAEANFNAGLTALAIFSYQCCVRLYLLDVLTTIQDTRKSGCLLVEHLLGTTEPPHLRSMPTVHNYCYLMAP